MIEQHCKKTNEMTFAPIKCSAQAANLISFCCPLEESYRITRIIRQVDSQAEFCFRCTHVLNYDALEP